MTSNSSKEHHLAVAPPLTSGENRPELLPTFGGPVTSTLKGTVRRITFRNALNGYSVLDVVVADQKDRVVVVGPCVHVQQNDEIVAKGDYITHPRFGRQFSASVITQIEPTSAEGLERYLASGLIKGIGTGTAKRIVAEFGKDTLEVIYKEPKRLARVPGIGKHKAQLIREAFAEQSVLRQIMQFLVSHRITPNLANKIYSKYGDQAVALLTTDPYILARDIKGVGFRTADSIATEGLHLPLDSPQRLRAGLIYTLEKGMEDGHCFLPRLELLNKAAALLQVENKELLETALALLLEEEAIISPDTSIDESMYLPPLYHAEQFVAEFIREKSQPFDAPVIDPAQVQRSITSAAESLSLTFSPEQEAAAFAATVNPIIVITGGPGCGKTTLIKALAHIFRKAGKKLILAAPTGRAAQRMSQVCDYPASTIHRMLRFVRGRFEFGPDNPLDAEVLVVDEASMIDIFLGKSLFSAIPQRCVLILVGDRDQLPSVGPGRVFADLISSGVVKTVVLSRLFRRNEESSINTIAHLINNGVVPTIPEPDGVTKVDAYFLPQKEPEEAALLIERLVSDQIPKKFGIPTNEIMVLTPSNRGPLGVQALNERLQERLNPPGAKDESQEVTIGGTHFRLGDRVVQRVNNYQIHEAGVFNGDNGIIFSVEQPKRSLKVDLWDGRIISYSEQEAMQLSLGYAMTVHRSQGSEIPCVVLILHDSHYTMLERQLVYTGVTRAKKLLIIVGTKRALAIASKRTTAQDRYTSLSGLIVKQGDGI